VTSNPPPESILWLAVGFVVMVPLLPLAVPLLMAGLPLVLPWLILLYGIQLGLGAAAWMLLLGVAVWLTLLLTEFALLLVVLPATVLVVLPTIVLLEVAGQCGRVYDGCRKELSEWNKALNPEPDPRYHYQYRSPAEWH
jgi:hypothetical protein